MRGPRKAVRQPNSEQGWALTNVEIPLTWLARVWCCPWSGRVPRRNLRVVFGSGEEDQSP
jgi:hypothetical protein